MLDISGNLLYNFAMNYHISEYIESPLAEPGNYPARLEIDLVRQWLSLTPGSKLTTLGGKDVTVIDPGFHNSHAGPDIQQAVLLIDSRLHRGAVECHLHEYDWFAHGHDTDRAYDTVILHLLRFPPHQAQRLALPAVALPDELQVIQTGCGLERGNLAVDFERIIANFATGRWQACVGNFLAGCDDYSNFTEKLVQRSFALLGAGENRLKFISLAHRINARRRAGNSTAAIGAALPAMFAEIRWRQGGSRPAGRPERRLGVASALLEFIEAWQTDCYSPDSDFDEHWQAIMSYAGGRGLQVELLGNVFLAACAAQAISAGKIPVVLIRRRQWDSLQLGYSYGYLKRHFSDLFESAVLTSFAKAQGLIGIYRKFCHAKLCEFCPLKKNPYI